MATSSLVSKGRQALAILLPSKKTNEKGTSQTPTFNPSAPNEILTVPGFRDHMTDIFATRAAQDSRDLIKNLMVLDPDMSAATNAFLTVADTKLVMIARDSNRVIDRAGQTQLTQLWTALTTRSDYSKGFQIVQSENLITEAMRYSLLATGGIMGELVLNKAILPSELRLINLNKVEWFEKLPGKYAPQQVAPDGAKISLDFPTVFATWFRRDPTEIYSKSPFISAINTIAARQQVINDLYRIMQLTGYPRMEIKVLEEVLMKNAPQNVKTDATAKSNYITQQLGSISRMIANIRPDQAFVHLDSVEATMMNEKMPAMSVDVSSVIEVLNAQNQAGLRTMATIIGRGTSGVNTASVEARVFALNAQALNEPVADFLSQFLTLALRLSGSESFVECYFLPVEMRSDTELETQMVVRQQRLRVDLSSGLISDDEYHLWMYGRLAPEGTPLLSGTNFETAVPAVDTGAISPNSDPLGQSVSAPGGNKGARDNKSKPAGAKKPGAK